MQFDVAVCRDEPKPKEVSRSAHAAWCARWLLWCKGATLVQDVPRTSGAR